MADSAPEDADRSQRASITIGSACLGQHECAAIGCNHRNHRRDMAYWDELLKMLGLKP